MTSPYIGEIRMFGGNFAPSQNALCQGQLVGISQNQALFALLGTYYGGNGVQTFGLPDFRGRIPINQGQGNGLSNYAIGQTGGSEYATLLPTQMPSHSHTMGASSAGATINTPAGNVPSSLVSPFTGFWVAPGNITGSPIGMNAAALTQTGGSQPHENRMPILAITFIIALSGIFPSRG
jgi:microcystin-dependent protein